MKPRLSESPLFFAGGVALCFAATAVSMVLFKPSAAAPMLQTGAPSTPTTSTNIVLIGNFTDFYITNSPPSIRWQWDDIRENNRLAEAESKAALEFQRTNTWTGPTNYLFYAQTHYHRPLRATTNDVELGFRSDGMVLWRTPPEAKP